MKLECFSSVVCWRLLNSFNTQVSGIQFNCPLSLLLPGVKPWTHISYFAMEDHQWLLWGQHFTYLFPPWKENIKNHYLSEEFKCPDFTDTILSLPDVMSLSLVLTEQSLFSFFDVFFVCDCSELENTENQGVTLMALKCLPPPPIAFHPTTAKDKFSLRRAGLVLQVPWISPMLYLSGLSIF